MSQKVICSLYVYNIKNVTRVLAGSILRPKQGGMVRFHHLNQVRLALKLQENNLVEIQSEIPAEILAELGFAEQVAPVEVIEAPVVENVVKVQEAEVISEEPSTLVEEEVFNDYLTYEQVEKMTRQELLSWAEKAGLKIAKNKAKVAAEVTAAVHNFLSEKYEDHVE